MGAAPKNAFQVMREAQKKRGHKELAAVEDADADSKRAKNGDEGPTCDDEVDNVGRDAPAEGPKQSSLLAFFKAKGGRPNGCRPREHGTAPQAAPTTEAVAANTDAMVADGGGGEHFGSAADKPDPKQPSVAAFFKPVKAAKDASKVPAQAREVPGSSSHPVRAASASASHKGSAQGSGGHKLSEYIWYVLLVRHAVDVKTKDL
jgi:hypothetical protein